MSQSSSIPAFFNNSFRVANVATVIAWLPLFLAPHWVTANLFGWGCFIAAICALYSYLLFFGKRHDGNSTKPKGNFTSLKGVMRLFKSPRGTLIGWTHYLAFDLMIGLYILQDSQSLGVAHWWVAPCLFLTLMFGPSGLLAWWGLRLLLV